MTRDMGAFQDYVDRHVQDPDRYPVELVPSCTYYCCEHCDGDYNEWRATQVLIASISAQLARQEAL